MIAPAATLTGIQSLRMFGRELVLYRGSTGRPVLLDAYCPHMQAHLGAEQTSTSVSYTHLSDGIAGWPSPLGLPAC